MASLEDRLLETLQMIRSSSVENDMIVNFSMASRILDELAPTKQESLLYRDFKPRVTLLLGLLNQPGSPYVIHCARKLLVSISKYLSHYSCWDLYIKTLWKSLNLTSTRSPTPDAILLLRDVLKRCQDCDKAVSFMRSLEGYVPLLIVDDASVLYWGALLKLLSTSVRTLQRVDTDTTYLETLKESLPAVMKKCVLDKQAASNSRYLKYKALVLLYKLASFDDPEISSCSLSVLAAAEEILAVASACESPDSISSSPFRREDSGLLDLQRRGILILLKSVVTANKAESGDLKLLAREVFLHWLARQKNESTRNMDEILSSLLHLFVDEDDLLLNFLLILMDFQSTWYEDDQYQAFFSAISPLRVFHLFLAKVHYDHSVLLDFLISESCGVLCLRYLLRCLKAIRENWAEFMSCCGAGTNKRKLDSELPVSIDRAKLCLDNLHESIHRLHEGDLFPYNAAPLLLRLGACIKLFN